MVETIRIRRGLDVPVAGAPEQLVDNSLLVRSVALLGHDYIGLKPVLQVSEGDSVRLGQRLFEDSNNPGVVYTAPGSGTVTAVHRGARHRLDALVIRLEGDEEQTFRAWPRNQFDSISHEEVRDNLLASGLWTALRTRPWGRVPNPDMRPEAIFITAIDTEPLAADPAVVVADSGDAFQDGVRVLTRLTEGAVYVCAAPAGVEGPADQRGVRTVAFEGPHPAGLAGTHIHSLHSVRHGASVWYLGYQDAIAIGRLFTEGRLDVNRIVAFAGPQVLEPRLVRIRLGADLNDLVNGGIRSGACRVLSGSVLSGRRAAGPTAHLGRYHQQVTVLAEEARREFLGWLSPGWRQFSASRMFASSLRRQRLFDLSTSQHGSPRAMVPIGSYERVMPLDVLITPLLKAILVGDTETAKLLGCLELEEEDLALCSFVCCSKHDFGPALRETLAAIEDSG